MNSVRAPAVADLFYPGDHDGCLDLVERYLLQAPAWTGASPLALIVPHAGYRYSGAVAGAAFGLLRETARRPSRVLLLGPNHTAPLAGIALSSARAFLSPLGPVPVDEVRVGRLVSLPGVRLSDLHHQREHAIEVQLPFLQAVLDAFTLLPAVVGDATPEQVADFLVACEPDEDTLIVVSSDLSHYLPQAMAQRVDADTSARIEALDPVLVPEQACGCRAINGLLLYARRCGLHVTCLVRCTSADTAGDPGRVVGYGSYVVAA